MDDIDEYLTQQSGSAEAPRYDLPLGLPVTDETTLTEGSVRLDVGEDLTAFRVAKPPRVELPSLADLEVADAKWLAREGW